MSKYDFTGWATKNNLRCSDGRTILQDAFKHNDGQTVPLVWNHQHNDSHNVLGHALLENRTEGVYAYCKFNDTEAGQNAKTLVQHGDVTALSIYANQLKQNGGNVQHGVIREVSLVLAGANPGAFIDSVLRHGESSDEEAVIYTGENLELSHAEENQNKPEKGEEEVNNKEKTVQDVVDSMTEEQRNVMYALIGQALEDNAVQHSNNNENNGGEEEMKHNVFENDNKQGNNTLSHAEMETIFTDAKRFGSLKESVMQHGEQFGIENIDYLFPDHKTLNNAPEFVKRDTDWVSVVMGGVHHTPFSRIKSMQADLREDEARARGYMKGKLKKEEVFSLLKRTTDPQTIYKKQKLHRDDVLDITNFDVVAWLKSEMRMMLDEEIARAILVGDGRLSSDDDKIQENHIRPIYKEEELYCVHKTIEHQEGDADKRAKAFIKTAIKARKDYKGSGQPTLFCSEDLLTDMLLLEDNNGRVIYDSEAKLATALRVSKIVTVPVMENVSREDRGVNKDLLGIIVNLKDYNVGADKGGAVSMFEDFDIDYNAQKYLIETRCSGALVKPFSAIVIEEAQTPARNKAQAQG